MRWEPKGRLCFKKEKSGVRCLKTATTFFDNAKNHFESLTMNWLLCKI